jgi:hypothetical protein
VPLLVSRRVIDDNNSESCICNINYHYHLSWDKGNEVSCACVHNLCQGRSCKTHAHNLMSPRQNHVVFNLDSLMFNNLKRPSKHGATTLEPILLVFFLTKSCSVLQNIPPKTCHSHCRTNHGIVPRHGRDINLDNMAKSRSRTIKFLATWVC